MHEELIGFIAGNPKRRQIIEVLESDGKVTLPELAKKTHSPAKIVSTMVDEMEGKGLIMHDNRGVYTLTDLGMEIARKIKGV